MSSTRAAASRWGRIITRQQASGLSIAEFCRRRDLSQPSFYMWRRRLGQSADGVISPLVSSAFVEVKPAHQEVRGAGAWPDTCALELLLPRGGRLLIRPGFDRQVLRELLAALEEPA
jgi:hypothetical protein